MAVPVIVLPIAIAALRVAAPYFIRRVIRPLFLFSKKQVPKMMRFLKRQGSIAKQWIKRKAELIAQFGAKAYTRLLNLISMAKAAMRRLVAHVKKMISMAKALYKLLLGKIKDIKAVRKILDLINVFQKKYTALTLFLVTAGRILKWLWRAYGFYDKFDKIRELIKEFFNGQKEAEEQVKECDACLRQQDQGDKQIRFALNKIHALA